MSKEVAEIDLNTLEVIKTYPSAKELSYQIHREYKALCKKINRNTRIYGLKKNGFVCEFVLVMRKHVFIYPKYLNKINNQ